MKRFITYILSIGLLFTSIVVSSGSAEAKMHYTTFIPVTASEVKIVIKTVQEPIEVIRDNIYPESKVISAKEVEEKYPIARYIWDFLQDLGYNDYVCAGIIGNMMVEAGGYTLAIQPDASTQSHYGICQWSKRYYPNVVGVSLDAQCKFLRDDIVYQTNIFGSKYIQGFNYDSFLGLTNERECALAFAKVYERCGSGSYTKRQDCATVAYNYFVNGNVG